MARAAMPIHDIDRFVAEEMEAGQAPGLALSISRDGAVVYQRGYGYADLQTQTPMTERTGVIIGSTTKALTCAALVQLADRGLLDLDEPIRRYIPWFRVANEAASRRMTLRQAVTHTAGLPPSALDNPRFLFTHDDADDALERYVRGLADTELLWSPGGAWVYANDGYVIAGRVIEEVTGMAYEDYMRRNVFEPLGLEDAAFNPGERPGLAVATPYDYDADGRPYASFYAHNRAACAAGSQLILTARDAARWLQAMLDGGRAPGGRLVSEQGYAQLVRPHVPVPVFDPESDAADARYGLGWMIAATDGVRTVSHSGATITMGSRFVLVPESRLAVAVLSNSCTEVTRVVAEGVVNLALGRQPRQRFPRVDRAFEPDRTLWPRLAGTYRARVPQNSVPGPLPVEFDGARLVAHTYPGDSRRHPGDMFLFPVADTAFVLFGRGHTGKQVSFTGEGNAVSASWEGVPLDRVGS